MDSPQPIFGKPPRRLKKQLIEDIINFVFKHLAVWRDDQARVPCVAEKRLTDQLCRKLNSLAENEIFVFHHESPQHGRRSVDFSVHLYNEPYKDITVFEAKRLPLKGNRKREYLTGEEDLSGGVQRFKACVHGQTHEIAAIIGYIQQHDAPHFHAEINCWIDELCNQPVDDLLWNTHEKLSQLHLFDDGTARSVSLHSRRSVKDIILHHLWVTMK